ncbi:MAG: hypothetical protein KBT15_00910 [Bacteroidales bacterium]|nr:hypothetical protein [Candidatus Minthousia equi]
MKELNRRAKCAIIKSAKIIIDADDVETGDEKAYLQKLLTDLEADESMLAEAAMMSDDDVAECIKAMEPDDPFSNERNIIVQHMQDMANADGTFSKVELREYFKLCELSLKK